MSNTAADLVATLRQRGAMLAMLVETPTDVSTLTDELSVSRQTIARTLAEFEDWGLITHDSNRVSLTLVGRLVLTVYDDFEANVAAMATQEAADAPLWRTAGERTEALELVANRLDVLEYAQTPRDKRTLAAELPYARSTVDWVIRELEVANLIQRTADGYTTTAIGQWTAARYRTLLSTLTDVLDARNLLARLPVDCPLPPALLVEAAVERADETTPYRLLPGLRERLATADQMMIILPALPQPQLLDVCHQQVVRNGATLELITDSALADSLATELPGPLAEMAAAATGAFTTLVTDVPPFGLMLADADAGPIVSVLVYSDQQVVYGALHTDTAAAVEWAEDYYEQFQNQATETTDNVREAAGAATTGPVPLSVVDDPDRVEHEAEGFVQLTPAYFATHAPASPATAWRTGFDLIDVHAGYAIDREIDRDSDGTHQFLTDNLSERLNEGTDHALIGPAGSGKSTVCKEVACRWYEQGRGAVFYRESGTGAVFDSPAILNAQLRAAAADGHVLVVVEDAVRTEANAIFRVMRTFRDTQNVVFLLDARTGHWADPPAFPTDARLDAYRTEAVETVSMPALDEPEAKRFVQHFQETVGHADTMNTEHLLRGIDTDTTARAEQEAETEQAVDQPDELLLLLHRLTLHANPLAGEDARTPTTLAEDVQRTYEDLRDAGDLALDVGVLVNLLNAVGLGVQPALIYALADDDDEVDEVRTALSTLEGQLLFAREEDSVSGASVATAEAPYRMIHDAWSGVFLDHLLDAAGERGASQRFGRCVSTFLALADDETRRERIVAVFAGDAPAIDQITAAPREWADAATERIFHLGRTRPRLAPLFGTAEYPTIELPAACSPEMAPQCGTWRGEMYSNAGSHSRAKDEFDHAVTLAEAAETKHSEQLTGVKARSRKNQGAVALSRGKLDRAATFIADALDSYRTIDDRLGEANCHHSLGVVAYKRDDLDRAAAEVEQSLDIKQEIGASQSKRSNTLNVLGLIASHRGDLDRAETCYERCIDIDRDLDDDSFGVVLGLFNLGRVTRWRGDLNRAEEYCKRGLDIAREVGYQNGNAEGYLGLGQVAIARGDLDRAAEYVRRSRDTFREIEDKRGIARSRRCLGTITRRRSDLDLAEEHLTAALTHCREDDYRYGEAKTLVELGDLARARDSPERAHTHFAAAVEIHRKMGAIRATVDSLERLAETCERLDDPEAAITHSETAVTLAREAEFDVPHAAITKRTMELSDSSLDDS